MDQFYPRIMGRWQGIPQNLSGVISIPESTRTLFFKDDDYWLYNNMELKPERGYPRKLSELIGNCH